MLRVPFDLTTEVDQAKQLLRRLASYIGGDLQAAEPARILRLPGSLNYKYTPARAVTIEHLEARLRYDVSDFDWLAQDGVHTSITPPSLTGPILEGHRNGELYRHGRTLRAKGVPAAAMATTLRTANVERCRPPLPKAELEVLIANIVKQPDRSDFNATASPKTDPAAPVVPGPSKPMAVARNLTKGLYTDSDGVVLLRHYRGDFYHWNKTCWPEIDKCDVRCAAYQWLEHARYDQGEQLFDPSCRKINDVIDALHAVVSLNSREEVPCWTNGITDPPASELIPMANGLLHVPTRTLRPHTPHFFCHHSLAFPFSAECAPAARWLGFLRELWPDDESSILALQEMIGYILGGDTRQQKIFLFVGPKRSGKGTIGRVLTGLLGARNVAAPTLAGLSTNFGLSPLIGRPLGLISDARLSGKLDSNMVVERLLSVSSEDSLTIDRKYREPWTGRLPTRFVVLTNEVPRFPDSSGALASRFVVFVLQKSFYGKENTRLTDDLLSEAPAIFNWALEGLDRLNERGHFVSPTSGREAVQQLEDLSSPMSTFVRDACVVGQSCVEAEALWAAWKIWCEGDNRPKGTKPSSVAT